MEVPGDRPLLADSKTALVLNYYREGAPPRIVQADTWDFNKESLEALLEKVREDTTSFPSEPVWAVSTGWWKKPPLTTLVADRIQLDSARFAQINFLKIDID